MVDPVVEMLKKEIIRIEARMTELQDAVKRHIEERAFIEEAKIELAGLHTRLDELQERERKYAPERT